MPTNTSTSCDYCPFGQTTTFSGSNTCQNCDPGKFSSPGETNAVCTSCPLGKFQYAFGASTCFPCSGFHMTNHTGSISDSDCTNDCIDGTFKSGNSTCTPCTYGTFLNSDSQTCHDCPSGRYGVNAGVASVDGCFFCQSGFYNPNSGQSSMSNCLPCFQSGNVHCPDGSASMLIDPGFWTDGRVLSQCVPTQACQGGMFGNNTNSLCSEGYAGDQCNSCADNYFRLSGACKKCIPKELRWFIFGLCFVVTVFVIRTAIRRSFQLSPSIKLSLFWFQVLSMYPLLFQGWPAELSSILNFFSIVNLDIGYFGVGCDVKRSFYQLTFVKLSFVPILWLTLIGVEVVALRRSSSSNMISEKVNQISGHCLYILNFFSLQIFSTLLQIFNCVSNQLKADPMEKCFDDAWFRALGGIIFFMFLYFLLVPAFIVRKYFSVGKNLDSSSFSQLISQISEPYRMETPFFEIFRLVFKLFFVLIRDVLSVSRMTKTAFLVLLFSVQIWLESWYKPYKTEEVNGLSML
jgi:hypothetical protein